MSAPEAKVAPATGPRITWMIVASMWLIPVFTGFGMTSWIGFGLIGLLTGRLRWILLAGVNVWYLVEELRLRPADYLHLVERLGAGHWYADVDGPLVAIYVAGILYGIHANKVWMGILWGRHEQDLRMLGWHAQPALHRVDPRVAERRRVEEETERRRLTARAAWGFREVLNRETREAARIVEALAAASAVAASAAAATSVTPAPTPTPTIVPTTLDPTTPVPTTTLGPVSSPELVSAPLPMTKLPTSTTSLGLPRGPLDVLTASAAELAAIPGLGAERAEALVAARETRTFNSVDEVVAALNLPALDLLRARPYLGIGPQA